MRISTHSCKSHSHPEFSVLCEDPTGALSATLQWFLNWLETEIAQGKRFLPEQTVQVGWSILKVRQRDDALALFEPDFKSMPIQFVDDISKTLLHMFIQKSTADSLGLTEELSLPSLCDSAVVCSRFGLTEGFIMSRVAPKGNDSGWFLGCDDTGHDHQSIGNLRRLSLYEAAVCHEGRITPFLGLPPKIFVGFSDGIPYFSDADFEIKIRPGSYLHRKFVECA